MRTDQPFPLGRDGRALGTVETMEKFYVRDAGHSDTTTHMHGGGMFVCVWRVCPWCVYVYVCGV